jgi:hypothetical protein
MKIGNTRYGRGVLLSVFLPYLYACGIYRGYMMKGLAFYLIYRELNALYDIGMYFRFFVYGPGYLKSILRLDENKCFGNI